MNTERRTDVMAMASFGGHLEELRELERAWSGRSCVYVTTRGDDGRSPALLTAIDLEYVTDCHFGQVGRAFDCFRGVTRIVGKYRPYCVVTTGALPGLIMALVARASGARVIWVDSLANAEELSGSGRFARWIAHRHLTQWPDVARRQRSHYAGSLL